MSYRLTFLLALFLLLSATTPSDSQQDERGMLTQQSFYSDTLNRDYNYHVYLPAGYETSGLSYPVIYLLHGRGDDLYAWLNVLEITDNLIASGDITPVILVMPDVPSSDRASYYIDSQYTGSDFPAEPVETAFFADFIPHIDATYRTIPEREGRIIGGYSMGGYGALRYSLAHPETFVGALVLSPAVYTPLPPADSSTRLFGAFGVGDSLFDEARYQSLNYPALIDSFTQTELALYMFLAVGDDEYKNPLPEDWMHDLDMETHIAYNSLRRVPRLVSEFRVYNGGHDWDVWRPGFEEGMRYLNRFIAPARPQES